MKKLVAILLVLVLCVSACTYAEEDWVCPNCGAENTHDFCGDCGTKKPTWTCPNCGCENVRKFCEYCGAKNPYIEVGDIVTLGTYAGKPIEWQVLEDKGDGTYVLLSVMGLDMKQYNTELTDVTWETCTLRAWLNSKFYETAFSESEKGKIVLSTVENPDNKTFGTKGGNTTKDYVYLLSLDEIGRYFRVDPYNLEGSEALICLPTKTAVNHGAYTVSQAEVDEGQSEYSYLLKTGACVWWLRSPGEGQNWAVAVYFDGIVYFDGGDVYTTGVCVRPVVCARL